MEVTYTKGALKQLQAIDNVWRKRIVAKVEAYAVNPAALANQVKQLQGSEFLRLRVGDYRVVFTADGAVLLIIKIGHRREIYG